MSADVDTSDSRGLLVAANRIRVTTPDSLPQHDRRHDVQDHGFYERRRDGPYIALAEPVEGAMPGIEPDRETLRPNVRTATNDEGRAESRDERRYADNLREGAVGGPESGADHQREDDAEHFR